MTGECVCEHLLRLLSEPAFTERARDLRDELYDLPAPSEVASQLARLAGRILV